MDTGTEIREAVKIIIERYRNHPEEFEDGYGSKFGWVFGSGLRLKGEDFSDVFNEAEKAAIDEIYRDYKYRLFHARVMQALLGDTQYEAKVEAQGKLHPMPGGWVNPQSIYATANNISGQQPLAAQQLIANQQQIAQQQLMNTAQMQMERQGSSLKPSDALNRAIGSLKELVKPKSSLLK